MSGLSVCFVFLTLTAIGFVVIQAPESALATDVIKSMLVISLVVLHDSK